MIGSLLLRGMIVGVVAGMIAFSFAATFGEPQIDLAIAFEDAANLAAAGSEASVAPPVSRETQAGLGLAVGLMGYGIAVGGVFGLIFAVAYGRFGTLNARGLSALLGAAAFVSLALVPQLKYPSNPPAVGLDETIAARTSLFFLLLALSVICMVVTVLVARRLWRDRGAWSASLIAGAVFVGLTAISFMALPSVNEMPAGFDPIVIWNFRIATLGIHLVLWLTIGLGFGVLAERLLEGPQNRRSAAV